MTTLKFHLWKILLVFIAAGSLYSIARAGTPANDDDYDGLDGVGPSGKKIDVIEWEGNLEIHAYPKGSLSGVGLKLDQAQGGQSKVMVVSYRLNNQPKKTLIRRYILGIPLAGFKVFKMPDPDCDKLVISRNTLAGTAKPYDLDPEPTQLYPDGHPMLAQKEEKTPERTPASAPEPSEKNKSPTVTDEGGITPFFK